MNITWHEGQVIAEFPPHHKECGREALRKGEAISWRWKGTNFVHPGWCPFCKAPSSGWYIENFGGD